MGVWRIIQEIDGLDTIWLVYRLLDQDGADQSSNRNVIGTFDSLDAARAFAAYKNMGG